MNRTEHIIKTTLFFQFRHPNLKNFFNAEGLPLIDLIANIGRCFFKDLPINKNRYQACKGKSNYWKITRYGVVRDGQKGLGFPMLILGINKKGRCFFKALPINKNRYQACKGKSNYWNTTRYRVARDGQKRLGFPMLILGIKKKETKWTQDSKAHKNLVSEPSYKNRGPAIDTKVSSHSSNKEISRNSSKPTVNVKTLVGQFNEKPLSTPNTPKTAPAHSQIVSNVKTLANYINKHRAFPKRS